MLIFCAPENKNGSWVGSRPLNLFYAMAVFGSLAKRMALLRINRVTNKMNYIETQLLRHLKANLGYGNVYFFIRALNKEIHTTNP